MYMVVVVSLHANTLRKDMTLSVLSPAMGKLYGRLGSLALAQQTMKKKNTEFKTAVLCLQKSNGCAGMKYSSITKHTG